MQICLLCHYLCPLGLHPPQSSHCPSLLSLMEALKLVFPVGTALGTAFCEATSQVLYFNSFIIPQHSTLSVLVSITCFSFIYFYYVFSVFVYPLELLCYWQFRSQMSNHNCWMLPIVSTYLVGFG